jgi:hypothetical protein
MALAVFARSASYDKFDRERPKLAENQNAGSSLPV